MSIGELFGWGSILVGLLVAFVLGAAPRFVARMVVALYPKGDARRDEVFAELAAHSKKGLKHVPAHWYLLGWTFSAAVMDGVPLRLKKLSRRRRRFGWLTRQFCLEIESEYSIRRLETVRLVEVVRLIKSDKAPIRGLYIREYHYSAFGRRRTYLGTSLVDQGVFKRISSVPLPVAWSTTTVRGASSRISHTGPLFSQHRLWALAVIDSYGT